MKNIKDMVSPLFFILIITGLGFITGVISITFGQENWLITEGILNQNFIYKMEEIIINKRALFFLCMEKRLGAFFLLFLLAFSSVNAWVTLSFFFFYGLCGGSIVELLVIQYGIQGILMYVLLVLPQGIFYGGGYLSLGCWCLKTEKSMNGEVRKKETKIKHFANKGQVIMAFVMVLIGVILESYVNLKIFKIFF